MNVWREKGFVSRLTAPPPARLRRGTARLSPWAAVTERPTSRPWGRRLMVPRREGERQV